LCPPNDGNGRGESEALALIERLLGSPPPPPGETWFGDDAAVLSVPGSPYRLLLATDSVVAGIDADLELTGLADLGWKALAVNLSDIAAMGGRPGRAVVSVVGLGASELEQLYEGLLEASSRYACPVVGGDLSSGSEVVVTVAVTGWSDGPPVLRSGARAGDRIWVSGPLGAAAAGLRLLRVARGEGTAPGTGTAPGRSAGKGASAGPGPQSRTTPAGPSSLVMAHARPAPAIREGIVAREAGATAMIDVSDGFAIDVLRLADASGTGLELDERSLPVAPGATLDEALGGGDDYVLIFTGPPGVEMAEAFAAAGLPEPRCIGSCTPGGSPRALSGRPLSAWGWQHHL